MAKKKLEGVRVAKIRNRYMFKHNKGAKPRGFHHYLIYYDESAEKNVALQTTHLYKKDRKRHWQLSNGYGVKMHLPGFEAPSMILKGKHIADAKGKPLDFAHRDVYVRAKLSKSKAKKVYKLQ